MSGEPAPSREALDTLVASHRRFLAFLERRTGDRALAEDLLQEAFVRGLDRIGQLRDDESAVAWFYRSLRNAVVDHHRRRGAAERGLAALARELEAQAPGAELGREICRCVGELATR
jgi:RNA polymerase sigma-70 factor (ECF subfamily)